MGLPFYHISVIRTDMIMLSDSVKSMDLNMTELFWLRAMALKQALKWRNYFELGLFIAFNQGLNWRNYFV